MGVNVKGVFGGCGLSDWVSVYFFGGCVLSVREDWVGGWACLFLWWVWPEYEGRLGGCVYFFGGCGLSAPWWCG